MANRERDKRVTDELLNKEWRVAIVWECSILTERELSTVLKKLDSWLHSDNQYLELVRTE